MHKKRKHRKVGKNDDMGYDGSLFLSILKIIKIIIAFLIKQENGISGFLFLLIICSSAKPTSLDIITASKTIMFLPHQHHHH